MKEIMKRMGLLVSQPIDQLNYYFSFFSQKRHDQITSIDRQVQLLLRLQYEEMLRRGEALLGLNNVEFRSFSQHGEDGILLFLFALVGTAGRKQAVEICAGDAVECNAANLIVNHGWRGLLFDGDAHKVAFGRRYYQRNLNTLQHPPTILQSWITAENVNQLLLAQNVQGEIDLLSLDLDGVDYWIWQALTCINPRVVVTEFNHALGSHHTLTVPYRPDFTIPANAPTYFGASLAAMTKLGMSKGYRLVGCEQSGTNAFFVRNDLASTLLPTLTAEQCFAQLYHLADRAADRPTFPANMAWVEV